MSIFRRKMTILAVLLSLIITMFPALGLSADGDSSASTININVQSQPKIEVVLAAGASNTNVSNFAGDLQNELLNKYGITSDRVKITAVKTTDISAKSDFNWKLYDHYYAPDYPQDGTTPSDWPANLPYYYYEEDYTYDDTAYFTTVSDSDDSLKSCYNRLGHIYTDDNLILFCGYSKPAFKDFMLYPDVNTGKKVIEFAIEESQIDTHTLEGAGFLFNTGITKDSQGVERMNGYLVIYDYSTASYDSTNKNWLGKRINLYKFSNVDVNTFHNEWNLKISGLASPSGDIKRLKSKPSQSTSTSLNIRIEASNNSLKLFEDNKTIYDTTSIDSDIIMNATGDYGFGPLVSYGYHGCESLTYFIYSNITMTTENVKSFLNIIREPDWQNNTRKFIVNLDDDGVTDFANSETLAEILYRMQNLDLSYIGWGLNNPVAGVTPAINNKDQAENFIGANNSKGIFINQSDPVSDSYAEGIAAIAKYISDNVQPPSSNMIILDDPYTFTIDPSGLTGTWRIDHDPTYFPQNSGAMSWDDQVLTTFPTSFDKPGKYSVYYTPPAEGESQPDEQKITDIIALWRPIASFSYDPSDKSLHDSSSDPNGSELTKTWQWKEVSDPAWTPGEPDPSTFDSTGNYLVQLTVQNAEGVSSLPCVLYISPNLNALPIASFTLPVNNLDTVSGINTTVTPHNTSYHPSGNPLDEYQWEIYDSNNTLVLSYNTETPTIDFANLPSDSYSIRLSVGYGASWSEVFSQSIQVIGAIIKFNPNGNATPQTSASTIVGVIGNAGDYPVLEYQWSTNQAYPEGGTWTTFKSGDTLSLSNVNGTYYLHIHAANKNSENHITSNLFILVNTPVNTGGGTATVTNPIPKEAPRIAGTDRFETAIAIAEKGWASGADTVVLANGFSFPDSLAAGPLAYKNNAPILFTGAKSIHPATLAEIQKLNVKKVILVGGTGVISQEIQDSLIKTYGKDNVVRYGGIDRYATASQIATALGTTGKAVIVNGEEGHYADALAISSYAAHNAIPILFTRSTALPDATSQELAAIKVTETVVAGGEGVVSPSVFKLLTGATRYGGSDRYATATAIATGLKLNLENVYVVTGLGFADALAAGNLAAHSSSPLIMVDSGVPEATNKFISDNKATIKTLTIVGGQGVITPAQVNSLQASLK